MSRHAVGSVIVLRLRVTGHDSFNGQPLVVAESIRRDGTSTGSVYYLPEDGSICTPSEIMEAARKKLSTCGQGLTGSGPIVHTGAPTQEEGW